MSSEKVEEKKLSISEILNNARKSAIRGGTAGAAAMGANVACLMWLRTTVNYQYRNGTSFPVALKTLYADGGIPRFYRGLLPALFQGPLSRFGTCRMVDRYNYEQTMPVVGSLVLALTQYNYLKN
jgi:hypothetical protein